MQLLPRIRSALLMSLVGLGSLPAQEPLPKPDALPDPAALATIIIPDLKATLTHIELLAQRFAPDAIKPGMLAASLGNMLADPGLSTLENKPVIVVIAPGVPMPTVALIVPSTKAQAYLDAGANFGMLMGSTVGDLAILARDPDGQALGERVAAGYTSLITTPVKGDLRILTAPDKMFATYGPFLAMGLQQAAVQMGKQPGQELAVKILRLEVAAFLAIAGEISASQTDVAIDAQTVAVDSVFAGKAGSALAKAMVAPSAAVTAGAATAAARLSPQPGAMGAAFGIDAAAVCGYYADLLGRLQAQPNGKELISADLIEFQKSLGTTWTGSYAIDVHAAAAAGTPPQFEGAFGTTDPAKARTVVQQMFAKLYGPNGTFAALTQSSGVTLQLQPDARTSGGIAIDKVTTAVDATKLPPGQAAVRETMPTSFEFAFAPQFSFLATDPKAMDGLIAGKQGGMTLAATRAIGPGRNGYVDVTLSEFAHLAASATGPMPQAAKDALGKLKPGTPITGAVSVGDGRARLEWHIPVQPILDIVTAVKSAKGASAAPAADPGF